MKRWVPDYSTAAQVVSESAARNSWTATDDGFVRFKNQSWNGAGSVETAILRVNGHDAWLTQNEARSSSGAISNFMGSGPIPVLKDDVIEMESTSSGTHTLYFYKGKWA